MERRSDFPRAPLTTDAHAARKLEASRHKPRGDEHHEEDNTRGTVELATHA